MNKFCKDCKWMRKKWWQQLWEARCYNPSFYSTSIDFVSGKVKVDASRCSSERMNYGHCKAEGIGFEPVREGKEGQ